MRLNEARGRGQKCESNGRKMNIAKIEEKQKGVMKRRMNDAKTMGG